MKKTEKTALTAAVFAAAMHMGTANAEPAETFASFSGSTSTTTVTGVESIADGAPLIGDNVIESLNNKMSAVYGPPPSYDAEVEKEEVTTTAEPVVTPVYGPPWIFRTTTADEEEETTTTTATDDYVLAELELGFGAVYGPAPALGDIDYDGKVDVYDLIMLRERFAQNNNQYSFVYDVNYDMKISVADLVTLSNHILGKTPNVLRPDKERVPVTTMDEFQGVYGPPPTKTTVADDDDENDIITTEPLPQPVYGPPPTDY